MNSLFICDLQREYSNRGSYGIDRTIPVDETWQWIRQNAYRYDNIITFYNGECIGIIEQHTYVYHYLIYNGFINERLYNKMQFIDKGCAYIFDMMDDETTELTNKDKRLIAEIKATQNNKIYNPEFNDEIYLPEVCDFLSSQYFGNITLIGGSGLACLKELTIFIKAKAKYKRLTLLHKLIYI